MAVASSAGENTLRIPKRHFHAHALHGHQQPEPFALGGIGKPEEVDVVLTHMGLNDELHRPTFRRQGGKRARGGEHVVAYARHIDDDGILV